MKVLKKFSNWLVRGPRRSDSEESIILWWELRRIPVNLIFAPLAIISGIMIYGAAFLSHRMAPEPLPFFVAPFFFNFFYTAGWVVELVYRAARTQKAEINARLMKLGLGFSVLIIFLPGTIWASEAAIIGVRGGFGTIQMGEVSGRYEGDSPEGRFLALDDDGSCHLSNKQVDSPDDREDGCTWNFSAGSGLGELEIDDSQKHIFMPVERTLGAGVHLIISFDNGKYYEKIS